MKNKFNKKAVSDFVVEDIIEKIKSGQFEPGAKLPSEKSLSKEFDISRASTREALQKLEVLGLIDIKHGKGSYVSNSPYLKPLQEIVASKLLTADVGIEELLETRLYIEQGTVRLAARNVNDSAIDELRELVQEMDDVVNEEDAEEFSKLDMEFHLLLGRMSGNTLMKRMLRTVRNLMRDQQERVNKIDGVLDISQKHHRDIFGAIKEGSPESAQKCMTEHLMEIKRRFESLSQLH